METFRVLHLSESGNTFRQAASFQPWPCDDEACSDCRQYWRTPHEQFQLPKIYEGDVSQIQAAMIVQRLVESARTAKQELTKLVIDHGDLFMSRWKKRSKDKKQDILLQANDKLPSRRSILFYNLCMSNSAGDVYDLKSSRTAAFRLSALLPYLAIDMLKDNPSRIFALVHQRSSSAIEDWSAFDMHQTRDAWNAGLFAVDYSPSCVVMFGQEYGRIVPFEAASTHRGDTMGYPRAKLVLEAQAELYSFLTKVVTITLEGADLTTTSSVKWSTMCLEGFRSTGEIVQWSSYSNAPFSPPPILDLDAIVDIAQLRFDAAADHLSLLQTEPAYMRRHLRMLLQGQFHKNSSRQDAFVMLDDMIACEVRSLSWWLCMKDAAESTRDVYRRYSNQIRRGSPLPREVDDALASLERKLATFMNYRCAIFSVQIMLRPGFAQYFETTGLEKDGTTTTRRIAGGGSSSRDFKSDPLFWCLSNIGGEPDQIQHLDHAHLFAFLEAHLANADLKERSRLDQVIFDDLSDLAANHQMLSAVRLGRPRNRSRSGAPLPETQKGQPSMVMMPGFYHGGPSLKKFFEVPPPQGKRDEAWIQQYDRMHASLSTYWSALRSVAKDQIDHPVILKCIRADLASDHVAELARYRQVILQDLALRRAVKADKFISQVEQESKKTTSTTSKSKIKSKTKPKITSLPNVSEGDQSKDPRVQSVGRSVTSEVKLGSATIPTTKRAIDVMSNMYARDDAGHSCDWDYVVYALKDIGFSARNSTGSCVVFELEGRGRIVFHRPHPVPKVDAIMLRAMGKRLNKWFGFTMETFVLEGANASEA